MADQTDSTTNASMIHGHAAFVAAAAKHEQRLHRPYIGLDETIGSYASTEMQTTGAKEKQEAIAEMRAAKAQSDTQGADLSKNTTLGKVEQSLGSATGCEGMIEEGAKRQ